MSAEPKTVSEEANTNGLTEPTVQSEIEQAKRAFALKRFEQAVEHYSSALEILTAQEGDDSPEAADLYLAYGKALLENAISQTAVLGKDQSEDKFLNDEDGPVASGSKPFIEFSGDAEDDDNILPEGEDVAVDLFAEANAAVEEENEEQGEDEGNEDVEDDFNAAWEVLDLARALYEKNKDTDDEVRLKLADTYITLGDVSLETEKFDQAVTDYTEGLNLKSELLPFSSRQIAEAHYKLSIVLDLQPGCLAKAINHIEKALDSVDARLVELRNGLNGQVAHAPEPKGKKDPKGKGKGKATNTKLVQDELVQNMSKAQIEGEIKELEELREDLALKVEELKVIPEAQHLSAPELAARALDRELNLQAIGSSSPAKPTVVNDLTSMVVKKKKRPAADAPAVETNGVKRKAEDESSVSESKKVRVEEASQGF